MDILSVLGSSALGIVGGVVEKLIAMKKQKIDNEHELKMAEETRATLELESKLAIEKTSAEAEAQVVTTQAMAEMQAWVKSYDMDGKIDFGKLRPSKFGTGLLTFVEAMRRATRPLLTLYLTIAYTVSQDDGTGQLASVAIGWWFGSRIQFGKK